MKNKSAIITLFALAFVAVAFGQDASQPAAVSGFTAQNIVLWLTPIITPLIIAGWKKLQPGVPSWALPLIAPVLGVAIDFVNHLVSGSALNLATAAVLGLAGVGLREVKDQLTPEKPSA